MRTCFRIFIWSIFSILWISSTYGKVELSLQSPSDGSTVLVPPGKIILEGQAQAVDATLDVVIVIDASKSTKDSSGADFNGDGKDDTILQAESAAASQLIAELEDYNRSSQQEAVKVGIVSFCGNATTLSPLTENLGQAKDGLQKLDYCSWTNFEVGIKQGVKLLSSQARPNARKFLIFLSDGKPNQPRNEQTAQEASLRASDLARQKGVIIHSFAIGSAAVVDPKILRGMAARTSGMFQEVPQLRDLPKVLSETSLVNIKQVTITVESMTAARTFPIISLVPKATGLFSQLLQIGLGPHKITVTALSDDGSTGTRSITVIGVSPPPAPSLCDMERAKAHFRQGLVYSGQQYYKNSELEFLKAIELCETYGEAYANLGVTYIQQQALNKAEQALTKAVELNPTDPFALYNLAVLYSLVGKLDLSLEALDTALKHGFNNIDALRQDPDLKNVRREPEFTKILEKYRIFLR